MGRVVATGVAVLATLLGGCVANVPSMGRIGERPQARELREAELVNHIKCELRLAVQRILEEAKDNEHATGASSLDWLQSWGGKVNLQLQVNEKSTFSPSISITDPLQNVIKVFPKNGDVTVGRNRAFGAGASFSSDVTRTETIGYFYKFADLQGDGPLKTGGPNPVTPKDPVFCGAIDLVQNDDLQIYDFLHSKMMLAARGDMLPQKINGAPFDVLSYQVKFIVTTSGSVTPGWKLARIAISPAGPMYNGQHVKTHDLTITLGPVETKDGTTQASQSLDSQHLANLIGRAVADAIRPPQ